MAFNVRVYGYEGLSQMLLIRPQQFSSDSVYQLTQPYKFGEVLVVSATAASSAPNNTANVNILRIEVPDGQSVRYEINPSGRAIVAGTNSPILSGLNNFQFAPGWSVSLIDAAGLP